MTKKKWKKILIIAGCVIAILLVVAVLLWAQDLVKPLLIVLGVLAVGWIAVELWMRWNRKRKQKAFDEGISAKEGIEDRKREWGGWVTELDRQGLDRYELPFYLLVGEPQAGKSVLLQNSDLHFPFGQERLSGVGGTRGCDWWFTDEAVILDLAGRLFTHEGGAADKLEWEAFLGMLAEFRPMCPANGVLLVVPCDSLLSDTLDQCADKANKIQAALLTLTQKLEANLPVYLVLTKADKIFGFAESVHRLEARMRHEMFGWSRGFERADQPLDLNEAKEGMDELVERARILRERMLATARIPEALPEVDRLYAFPDELAGLWPALEVYLKRTFTESSLTEKTSLRGIYLTSGLQTGAPIAKACADLLGEAGEADGRDLDSLFANQRAYFIKDVVRRRMFEERGLVRPTEGRVSRARQRAMVGYGASALLALAAVGYAGFTYYTGQEENEAFVFQEAITAGEEIAGDALNPSQILARLDTIRKAIEFKRADHEDLFASIKAEYQELYASCFDQKLQPALISEALDTVRRRLTDLEQLVEDPQAIAKKSHYKEFREVFLFLNAFAGEESPSWTYSEYPALIAALFPKPPSWDAEQLPSLVSNLVAGTSLRAAGADFDFKAALELRAQLPGDLTIERDEALSRKLSALADLTVRLMDGLFEGGGPLQPENSLGFLIAWEGLFKANQRIEALGSRPDTAEALEASAQFYKAYEQVRDTKLILEPGPSGGRVLVAGTIKGELMELMNTRLNLLQYVRGELPDTQTQWGRMNDFMPFLKERVARGTPDATRGEAMSLLIVQLNPLSGRTGQFVSAQAGGSLDDGTLTLNVEQDTELVGLEDAQLYELSKAAPLPDSSFADVPAGLETGKTVLLDNQQEHFKNLFAAKCRAIPDLLEKADSWQEIADRLPPDEGEECGVHRGLVKAILDVVEVLEPMGDDLPDGVLDAPKRLLREHLDDIWSNWGQVQADPADLHRGLVRSMKRVISTEALGSGSRAVTVAEEILWGHLNQHEAILYENWTKQDPEDHDETTEMIRLVNNHLKEIDDLLEESLARESFDRRSMLEDLDELLARRLDTMAVDLREEWGSDLPPDLRSAAEGVLARLDKDNLKKHLTEVRRTYPDLESTEYTATQRVFDCPPLQQIKASYDELQNLKAPGGDYEIRNAELGKALIALAKLCERPTIDVALVSARLTELQELSPPENWVDHADAGEFFLTQLQEDLRDAIIRDFRGKYINRVKEALDRNAGDFVTPLYLTSDESIDEMTHSTFASAAGRLLDPGGELDLARATFLMRPVDNYRPNEREQQGSMELLWRFEEFLFAWRDFLQNGDEEKSFGKALVEIRLSLPASEMVGTIWDPKSRYARSVFFASKDRDVPINSTAGLYHDEKLSFLSWGLSTSAKQGFEFHWTNNRRGNFESTDPKYIVAKPMAPYLLAWRGQAVDGGYLVNLNEYSHIPGVDEPAPIMIEFPGRPPLPVRPTRPPLR